MKDFERMVTLFLFFKYDLLFIFFLECFDGKGKRLLTDGSVYEGEFAMNEYDGYGV